VRFGLFEFSPQTGELWREGTPVRLQPQPAKALALLLSRLGGPVTREELQRELWTEGTHVDFERGLNFAVAQVRTALGDSAEDPRYIETLPKQGYRFIAPVTHVLPEPEAAPRQMFADVSATEDPDRVMVRRLAMMIGQYVVAGLVVVAGAYYTFQREKLFGFRGGTPVVVVIPFYNETSSDAFTATARSLGDNVIAQLAAPHHRHQLAVIGNAPSLRNPFGRQDVQGIAGRLRADYLILGQLKSDGTRLRLIAHLIRARDMKHVWAQPFDDPEFLFDAQHRTAQRIADQVISSLSR